MTTTIDARPDCKSCQTRAADIRDGRDPYTRERMVADMLALVDHGDYHVPLATTLAGASATEAGR